LYVYWQFKSTQSGIQIPKHRHNRDTRTVEMMKEIDTHTYINTRNSNQHIR